MNLEAAATDAVSESVSRLLQALGQDEDTLLAPALRRLDWVAALPNAAAPGFVYLAGAVAGLAVGGGGRDLREAAGKLAGETSEAIASLSAAGCSALPVAVDPALAQVWGAGPAVAGIALASGRPVAAPAAAIFRDLATPEGAPPRSLGAAAGRDAEAARFAGLMELVERDAAASWWGGFAPARAAPVEAAAGAAGLLAALREGAAAPGRPTTFLMLPSPSGIPVAAALSRDGGGPGGLVVGLKAAGEAGAALVGATLELLQMEIALDIVRLRAAQGRPLGDDAATMVRARLAVDGFAAFAAAPPEAPGPGAAGLAEAVARLGRIGVAPVAVDLPGLPGGLAVAKVFAPGLRPLPGPGPAALPGSPGAAAELI